MKTELDPVRKLAPQHTIRPLPLLFTPTQNGVLSSSCWGRERRCWDRKEAVMATSHFSDDTKSTTSGGTLLPPVHERLVAELESTEGQLGAIVR